MNPTSSDPHFADLPSDWTELNAEQKAQFTQQGVEGDVTPEVVREVDATMPLIALAPETTSRFRPNIVITQAETGVDDETEWFDGTLRELMNSIPGFAALENAAWSNDHVTGVARVGVYMMEDQSVTSCQWMWTDGPVGTTATMTCATRDFGSMYETFEEIATTLRSAR